MAKSDPLKSSDAVDRPLATPYELADIALRLAAGKEADGSWSGALRQLDGAWQLLDCAREVLNLDGKQIPTAASLMPPPDEAKLLAIWKSFPGANEIEEPKAEDYPICLEKAARLVSRDKEPKRRLRFIEKAAVREKGKVLAKELKALLETKIESRDEFWEFARWLSPVCPRFKLHYGLTK